MFAPRLNHDPTKIWVERFADEGFAPRAPPGQLELVKAVVGWAHQTGMATVELWVTRGNDAAVRLYETVGFRLTGDHKPLRSDQCKDELRMRRLLD